MEIYLDELLNKLIELKKIFNWSNEATIYFGYHKDEKIITDDNIFLCADDRINSKSIPMFIMGNHIEVVHAGDAIMLPTNNVKPFGLVTIVNPEYKPEIQKIAGIIDEKRIE